MEDRSGDGALSRRAFLPALASPLPFLALGEGATESKPAALAEATVAIVVRHAEKAAPVTPEEAKDPGLSDAGRERAALLARCLRGAGVTHLFATEFRRSRATLEPLATASGVAVEPYAAGDANALAARIRALPAGSVAVVAAHSNTLPVIVSRLGATLHGLGADGFLRDDEYDRLAVVFIAAGGDAVAAPERNARGACVDLRFGA